MDDPRYSTMRLMKRLIADYVRPQGARLAVAMVCMIIVAGATAANAWIMKPVLDGVFIQQDASMLRTIPLLVLGLAFINAFANYGQTLLMRYVGQRIVSDMQLRLFKHLLYSDLSLFHDQSSGKLIARFTNDINLIKGTVSNLLTAVIKQALTIVFLLGVMVFRSWELTLIAFVAYPVAVFPIIRIGKYMRKAARRAQQQMGEFSGHLDEVFQGVRTVKAYGREEYEIGKASIIIEKLFSTYYRAMRMGTAATPVMEILSGIAIAGVIWYGGWQVMNGQATPGELVSFITAMLMAYKPAKAMTGVGTMFQEGLAAAHRLYEVMDITPAIQDKPSAKPLQVDKGHIRFENISFGYAQGITAVEGVTLDVPAGKTVALVGLSGGGKSTLMSLLLRFYDVDQGRITIDGQDIREVTLASLKDAVAFVPQDIALFDDTVRNNIAYGDVNASEEAILHAARQAAADGFIRQLPQGYDTMIGPHGVRLSGGQRQRLAVARAMLKNAPILLLDEATSALDNESERSVQAALATLMKGRTTLVIAHRLSTIIHADIIYVMAGGRIVEKGTHDTLLTARGAYWRLYAEHQFQETV